MGWGIEFKTDVYLSRQSYASKHEVLDRIDEINTDINEMDTRLYMYAASTPRDVVVGQDVEDAVSWTHVTLQPLLEEYKEQIYNRTLLGLYVDYLTENEIDIIKREE